MAIDPLEAAAQRRARTGRSFFPAANTTTSYGSGYSIPSPENNPAYQAAINRPRPALQTIRLPSGGTTTVPASSVAAIYNIPAIQAGYDRNEIQGRLNAPAAYAQGYGTVTPPPSTSASRVQSGQAGFGDFANVAARNVFGVGIGSPMQNYLGSLNRIAQWFGVGGNNNQNNLAPSSFGGTSAAGAVPSPTPIQTPSPSPTPGTTPFKTASERGDLMNDINGTFYGGGHAPAPTPTPTPYQAPNMAYSEPRRYFDPYSGYA